MFLFLSWRQPLKLFSAGLFKLGHGEFLRGLSWFTWYRTWTWAMAYLISDKRHGNEVYVTKEALNCGFFFFSLFWKLEWQISQVLLCSQLQCLLSGVYCLLTTGIYFQWCVWSCPLKKRKGVEVESSRGLAGGAVGIFCFCWKAWCPCWRDWCHSRLGCKLLCYTELSRWFEEQ